MIFKAKVMRVLSLFLLCSTILCCTVFIMPRCYAKSSDTVVHAGVVCSARLFQVLNRYSGAYEFHLCASASDTKGDPVDIKRISVIMGNHPNYFPGWMISTDTRMFRENAHEHCIGPWYLDAIGEDSVGGDAYFDLNNGERVEIRGLRLKKSLPFVLI
ncbi:MAG: hypothetical protein HQK53_08575 [Oligoflexia bacterium]|nr:hypothetical protein [Oligoflexia bacterium]